MKIRDTRSTLTTPDAAMDAKAEEIAVLALSFLAKDADRIGHFMAISGLEPENLRKAAATPGFLSGILDYLVTDESLLTLFAQDAGIRPQEIVAAHGRLTYAR